MKQIKGMIVAPFTGFDSEGNLDLGKVSLQQKFYKDNGITGCFVSGTTGEGSALTSMKKLPSTKNGQSIQRRILLSSVLWAEHL